jgi:hypothetical protein
MADFESGVERGLRFAALIIRSSGFRFAGIAQLVEQLICNQQVVGSNPTAGSIF